jgi:hypothetical protein
MPVPCSFASIPNRSCHPDSHSWLRATAHHLVLIRTSARTESRWLSPSGCQRATAPPGPCPRSAS